MKSNRILAICILLIGVGFLNAQTTIYDANRWMGSDLNGTARFVGMGGAMGVCMFPYSYENMNFPNEQNHYYCYEYNHVFLLLCYLHL